MSIKYHGKILCIGDSLALPRGNEVKYEDTWLYLLKKQFPNNDFITIFKRGITTNVLCEWGGDRINKEFPAGSDCLEHYMPEIVILQLGIVDCAPRLLKGALERKIVSILPKYFSKLYISLIKLIRKRKENNVYVSKKKFQKNLDDYFKRCSIQNVKKIIVIKIPIPDNRMIEKNENILNNVKAYNQIFDEFSGKYPIVKCINPLNPEINDEKIYTDGYHSNKKGNMLVAESLQVLLENE